MKPLCILMADDHDIIRRGLRALLESHPDWSICAEACTGNEAVAKSEELKPDIAILDITMPELNGVEAARRILKVSPGTEILVLSVHYSDQLIREILDAGIRGYVTKSDSDRDLVRAVEVLATHKLFLTPRVTDLIASNLDRKGEASEIPGQRLTSRGREIIQMLSEGKAVRKLLRFAASGSRPPKRTAPILCASSESTPSPNWYGTQSAIKSSSHDWVPYVRSFDLRRQRGTAEKATCGVPPNWNQARL